MRGEVVRGVPFHTTNVRGGWNWRMFTWEVALSISTRRFWDRRIGNNIHVVKEYPEYFLGDVVNFFVPETVRPRMVDGRYEAWWLSLFWGFWITEVGQEGAGSCSQIRRVHVDQVGVEKADDDIARCKFARAFLLLVE